MSRRTTDTSHPWISYHYPLPDWCCYLLGFVRLQAHCAICNRREAIYKGLWGRRKTVEARGQALRRALVEQHQHIQLRWTPLFWAVPMANRKAWEDWRDRRDPRGRLQMSAHKEPRCPT